MVVVLAATAQAPTYCATNPVLTTVILYAFTVDAIMHDLSSYLTITTTAIMMSFYSRKGLLVHCL